MPKPDKVQGEDERWMIYVCPVKSCRSIRRDYDDPCGYGPHAAMPEQVEVVPASKLDAAIADKERWVKAYTARVHERDAAIAERDKAIAHDRQAYPTAWAYEQACAARDTWQARAESAEAAMENLDELLRVRTDIAGIVHLSKTDLASFRFALASPESND